MCYGMSLPNSTIRDITLELEISPGGKSANATNLSFEPLGELVVKHLSTYHCPKHIGGSSRTTFASFY